MYNENIYSVYSEYISQNKEASRDTQKILENFRSREEQLRDYHLALGILEKIQSEVGFYRLETAFNKVKSDLKNFDPSNIPFEIQKVYNAAEMIESYRSDIENLSKKIQKIDSLWTAFIQNNPTAKGTIFEQTFQKKYNDIMKKIGESGIADSSGAAYRLDNLKSFVTEIFESIEKAKDFQDLYVYMGADAKVLERNLAEALEFKEDSVESQLALLSSCASSIEKLESSSQLSTVGFPVIGVSTSEDESVVKYTINVKDQLVKYEPFFNSNSMHTFKTGEYLYMEGFPVEGVFAGREIIQTIGPSKENIQLILDLNDKIEKSLMWAGISLLFLSFITFVSSQIMVSFIMAAIVIVAFLSKDKLLKDYIRILRDKYNIPNAFVFSKLDFFLLKTGAPMDIKALKIELVQDFDKFFLTPLEGDYKWIQK